jgi:hypothetical protein
VRLLRARDDEEPGRIAVEPMDDSGALGLLPARHRVAKEAVDQRAAGVPRGRMDDDARRLVHDQEMLVLEGDAQAELLRLEARLTALR